MIGNDDTGEKIYEPTASRLAEARRQGQVARSSDLTAIFMTLAAAGALYAVAGAMMENLKQLTVALLDGRQTPLLTAAACKDILWRCGLPLAGEVALIPLAAVAGAVAAAALQGALGWSTENVGMDLSRLSLSAGLGKMFSTRSLFQAAMAIAKIAVVGTSGYWVIRSTAARIIACAACRAGDMLPAAGGLLLDLVLRIAGVLLALAAVDYLFRRWEHFQQLRMTRREMLDELRRTEGDPYVRVARRKRGKQLSSSSNAGIPARDFAGPSRKSRAGMPALLETAGRDFAAGQTSFSPRPVSSSHSNVNAIRSEAMI